MRRLAAALALACLASPLGASPGSRQAAPGPTERIPNSDPNNAYPRWLAYTDIMDGFLDPSIAVDSRNIVHLVQVDYSAITGKRRILHRTDQLQQIRSVSGFSKNPEFVHSVDQWTTGLARPDVAIERSADPAKNDRIHLVWEVVPDNPAPPPSPSNSWGPFSNKTDIYYSLKSGTGWSAPMAITEADWGSHYNSPQIKVDSAGFVHIVCQKSAALSAPSRVVFSAHYLTLDPAAGISPGTNPNTSQITNAEPDRVRTLRFALSRPLPPATGDQPVVVWEEHVPDSDPWARQVFSMAGTYSPGSAASFPGGEQPLGTSDSKMGVDVAFDAANVPHFVWMGYDLIRPPLPKSPYFAPTGHVYHKVFGDISDVCSTGTTSTEARVLFDSRNQVHVLWGGAPQKPAPLLVSPDSDLCYAARVANPTGGGLNTWRYQEPVMAPLALPEPPVPPAPMPPDRFWFGSPRKAILSANDVIHVIDSSSYTRTLEYGVGVRDSAAMAAVLPGGSVNVASGNLHFRLGLFSTSGVGPTQAFSLALNSLDFYAGMIGSGWKLNYEIFLIRHHSGVGDGSNFTLFLSDGRPVHFKYFAAGSSYVAQDEFGVFDKLELDGSEFVVTSKSGDRLTFNAEGKLREIRDLADNFLKLTWDAKTGRLRSVSDILGNLPAERMSDLTYELDADVGKLFLPRIKQIEDPAGKRVEFIYEGGVLEKVKFVDGPQAPTWRFEYHASHDVDLGARAGLPRIVRPPRGHGWTCTYLPDNRLKDVAEPLQQKEVLVSYKEDGAEADLRETRITNRRMFETLFKVEPRRSLVRRIQDASMLATPAAQGVSEIERDFDKYGTLTRSKDRWGVETEYDFYGNDGTSPPAPIPPHVRNNLKEVRRTKGDGGGLEKISFFQDYTQFSSAQEMRTFARRALGDPHGTGLVTRITRYEYNGFNQMTKVTFPDVRTPEAGGNDQADVNIRYFFNGPRRQLSQVFNERGKLTMFYNFDSRGLAQNVLRQGGSEAEHFKYDTMGHLEEHRLPRGGPNNDVPLPTVYQRDGMHRVETITDAKGRITTNVYGPDSNLTEIHPPAGLPTTTAFNGRGFVTGGSGPDGAWSQDVDVQGNVTEHRNLKQGKTTSTYDALDRPLVVEAKVGAVVASKTVNEHDLLVDGKHMVKSTQGPYVTQTFFDARSRVERVLASDSATETKNFYDEQDQKLATQLTGAGKTTCTVLFRDDRDRVHHVRHQDAAYGGTGSRFLDSYTIFSKSGFVLRQVDPEGLVANPADPAHKIHFVPDDRDRVFQVKDGFGTVVEERMYGDDDLAYEIRWPNPETQGDELVVRERRSYTGLKELKRSENASGHGVSVVEFGSLPGQIMKTVDANNVETVTAYHPDTQRPSQVTQGSNSTSARVTGYDWENGALKQVETFAPLETTVGGGIIRGAVSQTLRDEQYRVGTLTYPGGRIANESFAYKSLTSELETATSATRTETLSYNALGLNDVTEFSGPFGILSQVREFDGLMNLKKVTDPSGVRTIDYDTEAFRGLPKFDTFHLGVGFDKTLTHTFGAAGAYTACKDPQNVDHETPADANNRPKEIKYAGGQLGKPHYTPGGLLARTEMRSASGALISTTSCTYDFLGRKKASITVNALKGTVQSEYRWTYTNRDEVQTISLLHLGVTVTLGYNALGELESEIIAGNAGGGGCPPIQVVPGPAQSPTALESGPSNIVSAAVSTPLAVPNRSATYAYDGAGNRSYHIIDGRRTDFYYNEASQLKREVWPDREVIHLYDPWGNEVERTTTYTAPGGDVVVEGYGYDYRHLMDTYARSRTSNNGGALVTTLEATWTYGYHPTGERAYSSDQSPTGLSRYYVPRNGDVLCEYEGAAAETHTASYAQGPGLDSKMTRITPGPSGARRHYVGDLVGTLGMTLSETGEAIANETNLRDTWGVMVAGATTERYGFAHREHDAESSLVHMRARMYDPRTGRFTQTDPILGNRPTEHYSYASNNPVSHIDPWGLQDQSQDPWLVGTKGPTLTSTTTGQVLILPPKVPTPDVISDEDEQEEFVLFVPGLNEADYVTLGQTTHTGGLGENVTLTTRLTLPWSDPGKEALKENVGPAFEMVIGDPKSPLTYLQFVPVGRLLKVIQGAKVATQVGAKAAVQVGTKVGERTENFLYRAIKEAELEGIRAGRGITRPAGGTTPTQHVLGANKASTPWTSVTRSLESARAFATHMGTKAPGRIIVVDLSKLKNPILDVSTRELASQVLRHRRAVMFASKHKELLIKGGINPEAIIGFIE